MHQMIDRPPRIQPPLPIDEITIPEPPEKNVQQQSLVELLLPLAMIVGYMALAFSGRGRSIFLILPMALAMVGSIYFSLTRSIKARREEEALKKAYLQTLVEQRHEMQNYQQQQRDFYFYNYPNPNNIINIAAGRQRSRTGERIWERRRQDSDFGTLRLGVGTRPSSVIYKFGSDEFVSDPLREEAQRLSEDSFFVTDIPVTIQLHQHDPEAAEGRSNAEVIRNSLGIYYTPHTTLNRTTDLPPHELSKEIASEPIYQYINAVLTQFTLFHSYTDAEIFLIGSQTSNNLKKWDWARQLPHCRIDEGETRICFEGEKVRTYNQQEIERLPEFWKDIRKTLQTRQQRMREAQNVDVRFPFMLVVIDMLYLNKDSKLNEIESEPTVSLIIEQGAQLGAAIIFLCSSPDKIPSDCQSIIELERLQKPVENQTERYTIAFRYAEIDINTPRYVGMADLLNTDSALQVAKNLSDKRVRLSAAASLPIAIDLLQLHQAPDVEALKFSSAWGQSREIGEWPRVKVGMRAGGEAYELIFSAKDSGIHGLIAGTTGSGKSELLITIIVGLAMYYDPSAVNFLLIDFKGGAAFDEFRHLPHCVDVVTNLDSNSVERIFSSIKAELDRRGKLIADSQTKDIVDYRNRGYHKTEPLPHLFIIVDEFAEMIAGNAEYKAQLDSITRLGRAIGVSLILATQRPANMITDQMRANMKFRICLRVETPEDSRELLRSTEAAYLPPGTPGRGYVQVGNEIPELIQVARAGAPYRASKKASSPPAFIVHDDEDESEIPPDSPEEFLEEIELSKVITERLAQYANTAEEVQTQRKAWPDPLPKYLPLTIPLSTRYLSEENIKLLQYFAQTDATDNLPLNGSIQAWMTEPLPGPVWNPKIWRDPMNVLRAPIGLIDHPSAARQIVSVVDLAKDGHVAIFGGSGWGKTNFLRTLLLSLASTHSPEDLHIYILDFGGRALDLLKNLPHVGAVITADEDDRIRRMLLIMSNILDERKIRVRGQTDNFVAYQSQRNPERDPHYPAILVVIDNFVELTENFEDAIPQIINLMRDGRNLGIYFIASADLPNAMGSKVFNLFSNRFTLRLADANEYANIVGRGYPSLPEVLGRGLVRVDREISRNPLEFQVAAPINLPEDIVKQLIESASGEDDRNLEDRLLDKLISSMSKGIEVLIKRMLLHIDPKDKSKHARSIDIEANIDLLQLKGVTDINQLPILANWEKTRRASSADWPSVEIGVGAGNDVKSLTFSAKASGVHGLIAGTTGSGKSELLLTIIAGLAINYDPAAVNFLLIDFKGGAAFEEFRHLPHCIDVVTNLDKPAVERVFASIKAELDRRGRIIAGNQVKHIVDYRERDYHNKREPFPHLFIIIDEFAEMIADNSDYKAQLESITRLGRALGVSLLLATQRPAGVITDQMRANMKFRICLRVESPEDSRELLRRNDAAYLPVGIPGRAYLQVGNLTPELIQVAQAGAEYHPSATGQEILDQIISWKQQLYAQPHMGENGNAAQNEIGIEDDAELSKIIVEYSNWLAHTNAPKQILKKSWPDPLPKYLPLDGELETSYLPRPDREALARLMPRQNVPHLCLNGYVAQWLAGQGDWVRDIWQKNDLLLKAPIGLIDNPSRGEQRLVNIDLKDGHVVIFGANGWGKKTFLRTLITSMVSIHSPQDLHVYVLDFSGRSFEVFSDLPHVGAVINGDETERVNRLLRSLSNMLEERKTKIETRAESISAYNATRDKKDEHFPAVLVVINNFDEVRENFDHLTQIFISLLREGRNVGIYFAVTASKYGSMSSKIFSMFASRMSLYQADRTDYNDLVGRGGPIFSEILGRGLISVEREVSQTPLEFQVAAPVGLSAEILQEISLRQGEMLSESSPEDMLLDELGNRLTERLKTFATMLKEAHPSAPNLLPKPIENLSSYQYYGDLKQKSDRFFSVTLGVEDLELSQKSVNLDELPHFVITGPPLSGKTTFLHTWLIGLSQTYSPDEIAFVLIDPRRRLYTDSRQYNLAELPHVLMVVSEEDEFKRFVGLLEAEYEESNPKKREIFVFIDNYDDFLSLIVQNANAPDISRISKLLRVREREGLHFIIARSDSTTLSDDLMKQVFHLYRHGFGLQTEDALQKLNAKMPRTARQAELPAGRGYMVRSGRLLLMQIATPIPLDEQGRESAILDEYVQQIKASWIGENQPIIGSFEQGIPLYDANNQPIQGDISQFFILLYPQTETAAKEPSPLLQAEISHDGSYFSLKITNISNDVIGKSQVFSAGCLAVHDSDFTLPVLSSDKRDLAYYATLITRNEFTKISSDTIQLIDAIFSSLAPQQSCTFPFIAQTGQHLSLAILLSPNNQWYRTLYPIKRKDASNGTSEGGFVIGAEDYSHIQVDDKVKSTLLPVEGRRGQNQANKYYYKLLSAEVLLSLPAEVISQIQFEFSPENEHNIQSVQNFKQYSPPELQQLIDSDQFLLPSKISPELVKSIREQDQKESNE